MKPTTDGAILNTQPRAKTEIRDLIENWAKSVRSLDIEVPLQPLQDMLMFDVPPPVKVRGIDA